MRLIDADNLKEQVKAIHKAFDATSVNTDYDTGFHSATSQIMGLIEFLPTVDAVPVVRCKDCKYFCAGYPNTLNADGLCENTDVLMDSEDFCSCGASMRTSAE